MCNTITVKITNNNAYDHPRANHTVVFKKEYPYLKSKTKFLMGRPEVLDALSMINDYDNYGFYVYVDSSERTCISYKLKAEYNDDCSIKIINFTVGYINSNNEKIVERLIVRNS